MWYLEWTMTKKSERAPCVGSRDFDSPWSFWLYVLCTTWHPLLEQVSVTGLPAPPLSHPVTASLFLAWKWITHQYNLQDSRMLGRTLIWIMKIKTAKNNSQAFRCVRLPNVHRSTFPWTWEGSSTTYLSLLPSRPSTVESGTWMPGVFSGHLVSGCDNDR